MTDDTPLHERDEWLPPECKVARLLQMPLLAAQAVEIGQSRNPDGTTSDHQPPTFGSRPAARLDIIDVAEGLTVPAELQTLVMWCSRPIWESLDADTKAMHLQPLGTPTWATECTWLADVWGDSRAWLDEADMDMVDMTLDDCYRALTRAVGLRPPGRLRCPECGAELLPNGPMLVCEATIGQPWRHEFDGPEALAAKWIDEAPQPTSWFAEGHDGLPPLSETWFKNHRRRDGLTPASKEGREYTWSPWAVIITLWPAIAERREAA